MRTAHLPPEKEQSGPGGSGGQATDEGIPSPPYRRSPQQQGEIQRPRTVGKKALASEEGDKGCPDALWVTQRSEG